MLIRANNDIITEGRVKPILFIVAFFLMPVYGLKAQDTVADDATSGAVEQRYLVDVPTAGVLKKGQYEVGMRLFANGGLLGQVQVGMTNRFMFGISYGGEKFVGTGSVDFNPLPGVDVRYRVIEETYAGPAVTLGFSNQGFGRYVKEADSIKIERYVQKSRGFFVSASKNYQFMGTLGFHGGISWAVTEKKDKDNQPTLFFGVDKSLNEELSVVGEYDVGLNDNEDIIGHGRGYLNLGAKLNFGGKLLIEFMLKDVLDNSKEQGKFSREFRVSFTDAF